ncbi:MAG: glycosyltransferase family 39 protein [Bryobacteraceae bacterium]
MPRRMPRLPWLALPLAYFLYFFGLTAAGMIGPDEPRYASIGREMARTGNWITPRLWGAPWFEKPVLLYWMTGAAFRTGLGPDLAPRLPVALLSVAFLVFFWWILWREFGCFIAWMATLILATSAGWCLYSQSGVTDIPLSATFSAAMMLAIPWISKRDTRLLPLAGAFFALAVLAKGPVALILAAPLAVRWRDLPDWFRPKVILPFLLDATPWYAACYLRNGAIFLNDFFWKHNVGRFTSSELQHGQPWWFYLPALAVLFLPWSALLPIAFRSPQDGDSRRPFLLLWALWPLVFFSLSVNKLPGYILPAFPAIAALIAIGLSEARRAAAWLAIGALLTAAFAIAAPLVDIGGLARGVHPVFQPIWLLPIPVAIAAWLLDVRRKRLAAVACVACAAAAGIVYMKLQIGRKAFARELWISAEPHISETCVTRLERSWRYGLNYYSVDPLPDCSAGERRFQIVQSGDNSPVIGNNPRYVIDRQ